MSHRIHDATDIVLVDAKHLKETLIPKESELVPLSLNLVDEVWGKERPARPTNPVFPLDIKYAGTFGIVDRFT